jgi:hypothetical protein
MSQDSETPEQPETPETPAEPTPPPAQPPATPAMQPPTTPPVTQPAAPVAGAPAIQPGQGGLAIAAFVCGLGGIFTSWCCIGVPLAIAAVVCGILGKKDAEKRGASNWMWMTGLILGAVALVIFVIMLIIGAANTSYENINFNTN